MQLCSYVIMQQWSIKNDNMSLKKVVEHQNAYNVY